jgi:hypothetical protein
MKRKIKRLRELLVRHGNRVDILIGWTLTPKEKAAVEKQRMKYWKKLLAADPELLRQAADELNAQELKWQARRYD